MQKGKRFILPGIDYITILIILVFLALAFGVFLYYKKRLNTIRHQLRQTSCLVHSPRQVQVDS